MTSLSDRPLPLFYQKPQPLIQVIHDEVRLKNGDFTFAADANALPVTIVEFAQAMRFYPIAFAEGGNFPVAVLGLSAGNRFVTEGRWAERHYVPAYARRYPFVFQDAGEQGFALALDMASERVVRSGEAGTPMFIDGKPSPLTESALAFCREFHQAHLQTQAFVAALAERDLLIEQQADAKLASGEPRRLAGFHIVDREKFGALPDDVILDWHRKGWLALVLFHLSSLDRFADLLALEGVAAPAHIEPAASDAAMVDPVA
ncbi:MAG: SapC family protein [Candidatus Sphingomonas phytovorans]|nr:SapC family protein [Sphingomonas sp.]WEK02139.1 MAG: SapC family protein [Sphingomonas sp.]